MAGKKTIIIKKPKTLRKAQPISVYAEQSQEVPQLRTKKIAGPAKNGEDNNHAESAEPFKFYCVRCGQKLAARPAWVGREVPCNTCGNTITIPKPLDE